MIVNIHTASVLDFELETKAHALFCDAPYNLGDGNSETGFMGTSWDSGVAFRVETWKHLKNQCHPGAMIVAFGGNRTIHRMMVAAEDAGCIMHPMLYWVNAQGQPKLNKVDLQADRHLGNDRPVIGKRKQAGAKYRLHADAINNGGFNDPSRTEYDLTSPGSKLTAALEGWSYGKGTLAPRCEAAMVAQIPFDDSSKSQIEAILKHNTGMYNVRDTMRQAHDGNSYYPSNFFLTHDFDCTNTHGGWVCVDGCPVNSFDESDYFSSHHWYYERYELDKRVRYSPKVHYKEREIGLSGLLPCTVCGQYNSVTHSLHGREEHCRRNDHETLKPISLTNWVARLLSLPKVEDTERHIFIPFAGVASEMIGAMFAGWDRITGVELLQKNVSIATLRLAFWRKLIQDGFSIDSVLNSDYNDHLAMINKGQMSLFDNC